MLLCDTQTLGFTVIFHSTFWLVILNIIVCTGQPQTHSLSISLPPIMGTTSSLSKSVSLLLFFDRMEKEEVTWTPVTRGNCVQY